jgi:hypothetical protein
VRRQMNRQIAEICTMYRNLKNGETAENEEISMTKREYGYTQTTMIHNGEYIIPYWCIHYFHDEYYRCDREECVICSDKTVKFDKVFRLFIKGTRANLRFLFKEMKIPQNIIIIFSENHEVLYQEVSAIRHTDYGSQIICKGLFPLIGMEPFCDKSKVEQCSIRSKDIPSLKAYHNMKRVFLLDDTIRFMNFS